MIQFNLGDKVSVLDDDMDGIVIKVQPNQITIETTEGFELNFLSKELIVNNNSTDFKNTNLNLSLSRIFLKFCIFEIK